MMISLAVIACNGDKGREIETIMAHRRGGGTMRGNRDGGNRIKINPRDNGHHSHVLILNMLQCRHISCNNGK